MAVSFVSLLSRIQLGWWDEQWGGATLPYPQSAIPYTFGCPHNLHVWLLPYFWTPLIHSDAPICLDIPIHLDTPFMFGCPHTFRCPICLDAPIHLNAPHTFRCPHMFWCPTCWNAPWPPYVWHPHMFRGPHTFGQPHTFGCPICLDASICLDIPIPLDASIHFDPPYVWMSPACPDTPSYGNTFQPVVTPTSVNPLWLKCFTAEPHSSWLVRWAMRRTHPTLPPISNQQLRELKWHEKWGGATLPYPHQSLAVESWSDISNEDDPPCPIPSPISHQQLVHIMNKTLYCIPSILRPQGFG